MITMFVKNKQTASNTKASDYWESTQGKSTGAQVSKEEMDQRVSERVLCVQRMIVVGSAGECFVYHA